MWCCGVSFFESFFLGVSGRKICDKLVEKVLRTGIISRKIQAYRWTFPRAFSGAPPFPSPVKLILSQ